MSNPISRRTPAARMTGLMVFGLAVLAALAISNAIACDFYLKRVLPAPLGTQIKNALYRPGQLVEGLLCTQDGSCRQALLLYGLISLEVLQMVRDRATVAQGRELALCLHSPGGATEATVGLVLPPNVRTCVADVMLGEGDKPLRALCASACAWVWMAGHDRALYGKSEVGFHRPYIHDAPACVPGNWVQAGVNLARSWIADHLEPTLNDVTRTHRAAIRLVAMEKGPQEIYSIGAAQAQAMGLQAHDSTSAVFRATPAFRDF